VVLDAQFIVRGNARGVEVGVYLIIREAWAGIRWICQR
jgi:hypothetical protein